MAEKTKKKKLSANKSKTLILLSMALPGAIWFLLLRYLPMAGVILAFKDYKVYTKAPSFWNNMMHSKWVGLDNFIALFTERGDRLLLAVTDTAKSWVRADSNLHYGVYPNGSYGGQDYPYLTYNDLYDMQAYLQKARGARSGALDTLMAAKLRWMQKNGVTGYKK